MRYFIKAMIANAISLPSGKTIPFEHITSGYGVVATDDPEAVAALEIRIKERRGGISELTEEAYNEELKKKNASASPLLPQQQLRASVSLMDAGKTLHEIKERQSAVPAVESSTPTPSAVEPTPSDAKPEPPLPTRPATARLGRRTIS